MDLDVQILGHRVLERGTGTMPEAQRRAAQIRIRKVPSPEDIIEISDTDSDDEADAQKIPQAGLSRIRGLFNPLHLPLFLPDPDDLPAPRAGPSDAVPSALRRLDHMQLAQETLNIDADDPPPEHEPEEKDRSDLPLSQEERDTLHDSSIAQIIEIIPDVDPAHVADLVGQNIDIHKSKVVEHVLHLLFEDPTYPKMDRSKGKGKRRMEDGQGQGGSPPKKSRIEVDFASKNRGRSGGPWYNELAMEQLGQDFPRIPLPFIRQKFLKECGSLYAPTYLALDIENKSAYPAFRPKATATRSNGKGKGRATSREDAEYEMERAWLLRKIHGMPKQQDDAAVARQLAEQDVEESGIECGCCFSEYPFDKMIQCPEAHLFCIDCMSTYAETLLGSHDANIVCMDQSGCKLPFPESELHRFLSEKLLALYDRVKQRKEIEAAGLENLEECPFCDYKVVIDNEAEKLFRCEKEDCGAVTCRGCKKPDHLPKSCKEVEDDKKLDGRHAVEEAMTRALMRNCPKCSKAFVKEAGCNKMTCPDCKSLICYVCRKIIAGYDHFHQDRTGKQAPKSKKCPLWDPVEQRHENEVAAAAKRAMDDYKREHPEADDKDLQVDLPRAAAGPARNTIVAAHPLQIQHMQPIPLPGLNHHHMPHYQLAHQYFDPGLLGLPIGVAPGHAVQHHIAPNGAYDVNIDFQPRQMPQIPHQWAMVPQLIPAPAPLVPQPPAGVPLAVPRRVSTRRTAATQRRR